MDEAENQINDLEYKEAKKKKQPNRSTRRKRGKKSKDSIRSLWDNIKRSNICIIGVPGGEEKEQGTGNLFEKTMKENFPNLVKEIDMQVQEAQSPQQDG